MAWSGAGSGCVWTRWLWGGGRRGMASGGGMDKGGGGVPGQPLDHSPALRDNVPLPGGGHNCLWGGGGLEPDALR